jgi:hypothetical protein
MEIHIEVEFLKPFSERVISNPFSIMAVGIVTSGYLQIEFHIRARIWRINAI